MGCWRQCGANDSGRLFSLSLVFVGRKYNGAKGFFLLLIFSGFGLTSNASKASNGPNFYWGTKFDVGHARIL